jgi:hypothetical protein
MSLNPRLGRRPIQSAAAARRASDRRPSAIALATRVPGEAVSSARSALHLSAAVSMSNYLAIQCAEAARTTLASACVRHASTSIRGGRRWRAVCDPAPMCSVAIRRRCVWTLDEAAIRGDHPERTSALSRSVGGISRSVDPSGIPVQVVAGMHDPTALAGQDPQVLNFGHEWRRIKAMQRTPCTPDQSAVRRP